MKRIRQLFLFVLPLLLFLGLSTSGETKQKTRSAFNAKSQKAISNNVLNQKIPILPQLNKLNFGLGHHNGVNFYFRKTLSKIFFQDKRIDPKVSDIEFNDANVSLELYHSVLGHGVVTFVFDEELISNASDEDVQNILLTTMGNENNRYVFGNPASKIYDLYTCLHTHDTGQLIRMTKEEAEMRGYQPCGFCFKKELYLPDLAIEMEIEKEWSARLREYEPVMDGSEKQIYLSNLGHKLLQNWPFPLLGYEYSFQLIKSKRMNAIAIPTGKIVISSALMDALEGEEELEALLLMAIAHIERRHSLKQYHLKLSEVKNSETMRSIAKAAGSVAGVFASGGMLGALGALPFRGAPGDDSPMPVFEKDFEKEADALVALYFDLNNKDKQKLTALIKKLQMNELSQQLNPEFGDERVNVSFNGRTKRVENIQFNYFKDKNSFIYKDNGRIPVQLDFIYQAIFKQENELVVYVSDKSLLDIHHEFNGHKFVTMEIEDKHGEHEFKLSKKYTTEDLWGVQLTFEASPQNKHRFIDEATKLSLEVGIPRTASDKRSDQHIDTYTFFLGKLDF